MTSVIVFLVIMLVLVAVLLYARTKLSPQGKVKVKINGEKTLEVEAGSSLLSTLSAQKTFRKRLFFLPGTA